LSPLRVRSLRATLLARGGPGTPGTRWVRLLPRGRTVVAATLEEEVTVDRVETIPLQGIPEIRRFFRANEVPVYFVSATAFNLLGIDRWVRNFRFLNYYDSFDGWHPNVFVPPERAPRPFGSTEVFAEGSVP
jgi:hypothetical protein